MVSFIILYFPGRFSCAFLDIQLVSELFNSSIIKFIFLSVNVACSEVDFYTLTCLFHLLGIYITIFFSNSYYIHTCLPVFSCTYFCGYATLWVHINVAARCQLLVSSLRINYYILIKTRWAFLKPDLFILLDWLAREP